MVNYKVPSPRCSFENLQRFGKLTNRGSSMKIKYIGWNVHKYFFLLLHIGKL